MVHGKSGPVLEFPIPLFDQGQARIGRAAAELRTRPAGILRSGDSNPRHGAGDPRPHARRAGSRSILPGHHAAACMSGSSMKRSCTTTRCNWDRFNCCAPANSRSKPPSPMSKRFGSTGWRERMLGQISERSLAGRPVECRSSQAGGSRKMADQARALIAQGVEDEQQNIPARNVGSRRRDYRGGVRCCRKARHRRQIMAARERIIRPFSGHNPQRGGDRPYWEKSYSGGPIDVKPLPPVLPGRGL